MMDTDQSQESRFYFDPSDYPIFQSRVRNVSSTDPFVGFALEKLVTQADAIFDLPTVLRHMAPGLQQVLIVMDKTPMIRDHASFKPLAVQILTEAGYQVKTLELQSDHFGVVHPDFEQVEIVHRQIQPGMILIALGSGVVNDICKYACFLFDQTLETRPPIPFISIPTANSVPAYSSILSIISKDGVKRTWRTRLPNVILCDLKVLRDCPLALNMGGIGDMCAMYIASLEWFLGIYLGATPDSLPARAILGDAKTFLYEYANEIGTQSLAGTEIMVKILTLGGLAMSFANDSSPMSGYEHGVAHLLDMGAEYFGRPIRNHGSQVAIAGILVLIGFERFLDTLNPSTVDVDRCYTEVAEAENRIHSIFAQIDPSGAMGEECWRDYKKKLLIWQQARPRFEQMLAEWPELRLTLKELILPAKTYVKMLLDSGHPLTFPEIGVAETEARWAYQNGYTLRKRLSMTDLLFFMGWFNDDWVDWIFREARHLVTQAREERTLLER